MPTGIKLVKFRILEEDHKKLKGMMLPRETWEGFVLRLANYVKND